MTVSRLAILGNPVEHSRSPEIHEMFAQQAGIEITYEKLLVPTNEFRRVATAFMAEGTGFNVTLPCKFDAWELVDKASDKANLAQAVNTVSRGEGGLLVGDNTDGIGMITDMTHNLGWEIRGSRILILGAGGAVSGVLGDLLNEKPASIHLFNRTHGRAQALQARFGSEKLTATPAEDLEDGYDLIINGTSAGLMGEDLPLPGRIVAASGHCYDMVYGRGPTRFNVWCEQQQRCFTADGLGMLVEQAAHAFRTWFGFESATRPVIENLQASLQS